MPGTVHQVMNDNLLVLLFVVQDPSTDSQEGQLVKVCCQPCLDLRPIQAWTCLQLCSTRSRRGVFLWTLPTSGGPRCWVCCLSCLEASASRSGMGVWLGTLHRLPGGPDGQGVLPAMPAAVLCPVMNGMWESRVRGPLDASANL